MPVFIVKVSTVWGLFHLDCDVVVPRLDAMLSGSVNRLSVL